MRTYAHHLCDVYNGRRSDEAKARGVEWYVTPSGELRIGDNLAWSEHHAKKIERNRESERARFNRMNLESERAKGQPDER